MMRGVIDIMNDQESFCFSVMDPNANPRTENEVRNEESPDMITIGEVEDYISLYGERRGAIPTKHLRGVIADEFGKCIKTVMPSIMTEMKNEIRSVVREEFHLLKNEMINEVKEDKIEVKAEGSRKRSGCETCGKNHTGQCKHKTKGCYTCGEVGHNYKDCLSLGKFCYDCAQYGHESSECPN